MKLTHVRKLAFALLLFAAPAAAQQIWVNTPVKQNNQFDPTLPMQSWECSTNQLGLGTHQLDFLDTTGAVADYVDCNGVVHSSGGGTSCSGTADSLLGTTTGTDCVSISNTTFETTFGVTAIENTGPDGIIIDAGGNDFGGGGTGSLGLGSAGGIYLFDYSSSGINLNTTSGTGSVSFVSAGGIVGSDSGGEISLSESFNNGITVGIALEDSGGAGILIDESGGPLTVAASGGGTLSLTSIDGGGTAITTDGHLTTESDNGTEIEDNSSDSLTIEEDGAAVIYIDANGVGGMTFDATGDGVGTGTGTGQFTVYGAGGMIFQDVDASSTGVIFIEAGSNSNAAIQLLAQGPAGIIVDATGGGVTAGGNGPGTGRAATYSALGLENFLVSAGTPITYFGTIPGPGGGGFFVADTTTAGISLDSTGSFLGGGGTGPITLTSAGGINERDTSGSGILIDEEQSDIPIIVQTLAMTLEISDAAGFNFNCAGNTFGDLPASPAIGSICPIVDSNTALFNTAITAGGGGNSGLALYNGTAWTFH